MTTRSASLPTPAPSPGPSPVDPAGWARGRGFSHGVTVPSPASWLAVSGQIGAPPGGRLRRTFVEQVAQALDNVLAVVAAGGGQPGSLVAMTWYVTSMARYRRARPRLAPVWRARFGAHYPAMTLVEVGSLVDESAQVEIAAWAVVRPARHEARRGR